MKELGRIIKLHQDTKSDHTIVGNSKELPFLPKRVYWIYDVPGGENRGGHAHKKLRQVIIAVNGSFTVNLDNGHEKKQYLLNNPTQGLYLDTEIWRTLDDFSSGAVCLVLASELYEPEDYLYEYDEFIDYITHKNNK